MLANFTNHEKRSLVEVEVTFHPEALREALLGRGGALWKLLRGMALALAFLLALGVELAMPRHFPEVPVRPLLLMVAYMALHASLGVALAVALVAGWLLDAGGGLLPGAHLLPMVLVAGLLQLLRNLPSWDELGGWVRAAVAGALATFLMTAYETLGMGVGTPWDVWWRTALREGLLGTALAGVAAAPALFFLLDWLRTLGTDETLFVPKVAPASENIAQING